MNPAKKFNHLDAAKKITVNTSDLQAMLGCGRSSAVRIGDEAGARVQIGKRVLWNVERIKQYVDEISI